MFGGACVFFAPQIMLAPVVVDHGDPWIVRVFSAQQVEVALGLGHVAHGKVQVSDFGQGLGDVE